MRLAEKSVYACDFGPGVQAGFTTVHGGVSLPPWGEFNLGLNTGDDRVRVLQNRKLLQEAVGRPVAFGAQVHGAEVGVSPELTSVEFTSDRTTSTEVHCGPVDAIIVTRSSVAAAVLVADCVPVLVVDAAAGIGAVIHAGRAGLIAGVLQAAVQEMVLRGAETGVMKAIIGPAACGRCYEVPKEMQLDVVAQIPQTVSYTNSGTPALDLPTGAAAVLRESGVLNVEQIAICTIESPDFYSYRGAGGANSPTGRFAGVLALS